MPLKSKIFPQLDKTIKYCINHVWNKNVVDGASQYEKPNPSEGPNISKVAYDYNQNQWYTPLLKRNDLTWGGQNQEWSNL